MVASGQRQADRPAPLRLTRRGWVVLLILLMIAASLLGALLATATRAVVSVPMIPVSQVVDGSPDMLWSIVDGSVSRRRCDEIPFRGGPETLSGRCG